MTDVVLYITKVSLVISLLYGFYQLLLKNSTHFTWNRVYLISGIFIAVLLPFWPINQTPAFPLNFNFNLDTAPIVESLTQVSGPAERWDLSLCLGLIYFAGMLIMLFRLASIDASLRKLIYTSRVEKHPDFNLISGKTIQFPFSFRRNIFMPDSMKMDANTAIILKHEEAHIKGKHSLDIILVEVFLLLQWFNPLAWMYKKSLLTIHEYLADQSLISEGIDKSDYQLLLLKQSAGNQRFALTNAFNEHTTIKRINMMNQNKSSKWSQFKYLLLLPILGLSLYSFKALPSGTDIVASITGQKVIKGHVLRSSDQSPIAGVAILIKESSVGTLTNEVGYFEIMLPENSSSTLTFSFIGLASYQVELKESGIIKVELGASEATSKHSFLKTAEGDVDLGKQIKLTSKNPKAPLMIVDGEEVKEGFEMSSISPDDIESVSVIKGAKAIEEYGEKGRNGVVEITTKKK